MLTRRQIMLFIIGLGLSSVIFFHPQPIQAASITQSVIEAYSTAESVAIFPVRLPTEIPLNSPAAPAADNIWGRSVIAEPEKYLILINRVENCEGVNECTFAVVEAEPLESDAPSLEDVFDGYVDPTGQKGPVNLDNGIEGYFVPAEEGLYEPSVIAWDEGNVRYQVSIYMGAKADLLEMANSAID